MKIFRNTLKMCGLIVALMVGHVYSQDTLLFKSVQDVISYLTSVGLPEDIIKAYFFTQGFITSMAADVKSIPLDVIKEHVPKIREWAIVNRLVALNRQTNQVFQAVDVNAGMELITNGLREIKNDILRTLGSIPQSFVPLSVERDWSGALARLWSAFAIMSYKAGDGFVGLGYHSVRLITAYCEWAGRTGTVASVISIYLLYRFIWSPGKLLPRGWNSMFAKEHPTTTTVTKVTKKN